MTCVERTREIIRRLGEFDFDGLRPLLSPEFVQEYPFRPTPGSPTRIEGIDAFFDFCRPGMTAFDPYAFRIRQIYETTDPLVVIAEYTSHTRLLATGRPYSNQYVGIFAFDPEGRLTLWREYLDAQAIATAFGD